MLLLSEGLGSRAAPDFAFMEFAITFIGSWVFCSAQVTALMKGQY